MQKLSLLIFVTLIVSACSKQSEPPSRLSTLQEECGNNSNYQRFFERRYRLCDQTGRTINQKTSCLRQLDTAISRQNGACRDLASLQFRNLSYKFVEEELSKATIDPNLGILDPSAFADYLAMSDVWYNYRESVNIESLSAFDQDNRKLLNKIWNTFTQSNLSTTVSSSAKIIQQDLVILEHIQNNQPENEIALLSIQNHMVETIVAKMTTLAPIVDLSCRISNCRSNPPALLRSVQAIANLASIERDSTFFADDEVFAGLKNAFESSRELITEKLGVSDLDVIVSGQYSELLVKADFEIQRLIINLRKAKVLADNFSSTGTFTSDRRLVIDSGLDTDVVRQMISLSNRLAESLQLDSQTYQQNRIQLANAIRQVIDDANELTRINFERKESYRQLNFILNELEATRTALLATENDFSVYSQQLKELRDSEGIRYFKDQLVNTEQSVFTVSPSDSLFSVGDTTSSGVDSLSLVKPIEVSEGEILNVSISGDWAPICALKKSEYADLANDGLLLGPEGFTIVSAQGDSQVDAVSTRRSRQSSQNLGVSNQNCIQGQTSIGISENFNNAISLGTSLSTNNSNCSISSINFTTLTERSNTQTNSSSLSNTAQFASGMRLPNTPFSSYPAGALLALVMPGQSKDVTKALEVKVMSSNSSILASGDGQVYFVVNDCNDGDQPQRSLTVRADKLANNGADIERMLDAIIEVIRTVRSKGAALIQEGGPVSSRSAAIRSDAVRSLIEASDAPLAFFQIPSLNSAFNAWVDNEIARVERLATIRDYERQLERLLLEISKQEQLLNNAEKKQLYGQEIASIAAENIDFSASYSELKQLSDLLLKRLYPMVEIHFPDLLVQLPISLEKVANIDIGTEYTTVVRYVSDIAQRLSQLSEEQTLLNSVNKQERVVQFRFLANDYEGDSFAPFADRTRSDLIFDALLSEQKGFVDSEMRVEIRPDDLYKDANQFSKKLFCRESLPLISDIKVFLVFDASTVSDLSLLRGYELELQLGSEMDLPTASGKSNLALTNPFTGFTTVPVIPITNLDRSAIETQMLATEGTAARGLSPFTSYGFAGNLEGLKEQIRRLPPATITSFDPVTGVPSFESRSALQEIVIGYRLTTDDTAGTTAQNWIANCQ